MKRELAKPARDWQITKDGKNQTIEGPFADFLNRSTVGERLELHKSHFLLKNEAKEQEEAEEPEYILKWSEKKPIYLADEGYHDDDFYTHREAAIDSVINCGEFFVIYTNEGTHILQWGKLSTLLVYPSPE